MEWVYIIKIGEIALKGKNRSMFENMLAENVKKRLPGCRFRFARHEKRYYVYPGPVPDSDIEAVLSTVFGITGYAKALKVEKSMKGITEGALRIAGEFARESGDTTFKIQAKRSDKSFPETSYEIACALGNEIREQHPGFHVDLSSHELRINVEIRKDGWVYGNDKPGPGGIPTGCSGKGTLLLSGGIDSPVAGYLMAKRGLKLQAVYFHAYPYTSAEAKQKVIDLAAQIAPWNCGMQLYVIPFTEPQLRIKERGRPKEVTLLMRHAMMKTASRLNTLKGGLALVTGESLGQVASQTAESMGFTAAALETPVFRPLIGFDKQETIRIARNIGTYRISVLPYEDCCTIFSPKHPVLHPVQSELLASYDELDLDGLLQAAMENAEMIEV